MGIKINDLQPLGASLLSGNESLMDNLRELSPEELRISGRGKKDSIIILGGGVGGVGGFGGTGSFISSGFGGKKDDIIILGNGFGGFGGTGGLISTGGFGSNGLISTGGLGGFGGFGGSGFPGFIST